MIVIKNGIDQEGPVDFDDVTMLVGVCETEQECRDLIQKDFDEWNEVDEDDEGHELDWSNFDCNSVRILVIGDDDDNVLLELGYVIL